MNNRYIPLKLRDNHKFGSNPKPNMRLYMSVREDPEFDIRPDTGYLAKYMNLDTRQAGYTARPGTESDRDIFSNAGYPVQLFFYSSAYRQVGQSGYWCKN